MPAGEVGSAIRTQRERALAPARTRERNRERGAEDGQQKGETGLAASEHEHLLQLQPGNSACEFPALARSLETTSPIPPNPWAPIIVSLTQTRARALVRSLPLPLSGGQPGHCSLSIPHSFEPMSSLTHSFEPIGAPCVSGCSPTELQCRGLFHPDLLFGHLPAPYRHGCHRTLVY